MSKNSKRVLVVEDERPIANALKLKLGRNGIETKTVFDGESALKLLKKETFDLIILDLVMPKIDGFAVLHELKARKNKTPIIVTTNLSQEEDLERAKQLGASDYFVKSDTTIANVVEHIKEFLFEE